MSNQKTSITNLLRLAFVFAIGFPMVINLFSRQSIKILWRKVDQEYLTSLRVLLSSLESPESSKIKNLETLCQIHTTLYNNSSRIIKINEKQLITFIKKQKIFKDAQGNFSTDLYKQFLIKNNIHETILNQVMREICSNEIYTKTIDGAFVYLNEIITEEITHIITNKQIVYDTYTINGHMMKINPPTEKDLINTYEIAKKNHNPLVFGGASYEGVLIRQKIHFNSSPSLKEIEDYYQLHKIQYAFKKIKIITISFPTEEMAKEVMENYQNKKITLKEIHENYLTESHTLDSQHSPRETHQLTLIYQRIGIKNPMLFSPNKSGSIFMYIDDYQIEEVPLNQVKDKIIKEIQRKTAIELGLKHLRQIKMDIKHKPSLLNDEEHIKKNHWIVKEKIHNPSLNLHKNLNNSIDIQKVFIDKLDKEWDHLIEAEENYHLYQDELTIFLPLKKTSKHLLMMKDINKNTLVDLYKDNQRKILTKQEAEKMRIYLEEGIKNDYNRPDNLWNHKNGMCNILSIFSPKDIETQGRLLQALRNTVIITPHQELIKTRLIPTTITISPYNKKLLNDLLSQLIYQLNKEYIVNLLGKISYFNTINKYNNFLTRYFMS